MIAGKPTTVARGQLLTSQVGLAARWGWHRETVSDFIKALRSDFVIDIQTGRGSDIGYTLITIRNYERYQSGQNNEIDIEADIETGFENESETTLEPAILKEDKKNKEYRTPQSGARPVSAKVEGFKEAMALYHDLFLKTVGAKPDIDRTDGKILKDLLKYLGKDEVMKIIGYFFEHPPDCSRSKGKYTLQEIKRIYNELLAMMNKRVMARRLKFVG